MKYQAFSKQEQVRNYLLSKISGGLKDGDKLPSENKLAKELGVSKSTVRNTVEEMVASGILVQKQGMGTFVNNAEHKDVKKLKQNTKKLISYVSPFGHHDLFLKDITLGIEEGFPGENFLLMNKHFDLTSSNEGDVIEKVAEVSDGMILISTMGEDSRRALNKLTEEKFPIVLIDRYASDIPCGSVCTDNEEGGMMAVEYLFSKGHKRIRHISADHYLTSTLGRRDGYLTGMKRMGLEPDIFLIPDKWSEKSFERVLEKDRKKWPDALFTSNETIAMALYDFLTARGINIPKEISLMSYGDPQGDELTTISQPKRQIGFKAARLLASILDGESELNTRFMLQPKLIERRSVKSI